MIEIEASNVLYFLLFRLLSSSHPSTYRSFLVHLKPGTQKCQCNKKKIVWLYTSSPWLQAQFFHAAVDNGRFFRMGNTCCCCHAARFILWWIVDVKCRKRERERKKKRRRKLNALFTRFARFKISCPHTSVQTRKHNNYLFPFNPYAPFYACLLSTWYYKYDYASDNWFTLSFISIMI